MGRSLDSRREIDEALSAEEEAFLPKDPGKMRTISRAEKRRIMESRAAAERYRQSPAGRAEAERLRLRNRFIDAIMNGGG